MPVIMSGIWTGSGLDYQLATLAALIGAGDWVPLSFWGIGRNNTSLILIGALSSAVLAIAFNSTKSDGKSKIADDFLWFLPLVTILLGLSWSSPLGFKKRKKTW